MIRKNNILRENNKNCLERMKIIIAIIKTHMLLIPLTKIKLASAHT